MTSQENIIGSILLIIIATLIGWSGLFSGSVGWSFVSILIALTLITTGYKIIVEACDK